jgi:hypothetical protein
MLTLKMKPAAATTSVIRLRPFIKNNIMRFHRRKKEGRLRCRKQPKSREETPNEGSDSGAGVGVATAYPYLR